VIDPVDLGALERHVHDALGRGDASGLCVLGYGEISTVLGWPVDTPTWACKRLPPFPSADAADRYAAVFARYLDELSTRGVHVVDSVIAPVLRDAGDVVLYCVQPVLPVDTLGPNVAARGGGAARDLFALVVDTVLAVVDAGVGLDAQLSNWAMLDGSLTYFDVTTPMLAAPDGSSQLDTEVFLASLPWALRAPVRRFVLPDILDRYHSTRTVVLDLAANLLKERLDEWIPTVLELTDGRLEPPLTADEVRRDYRSDARTWNLLQALRRADRSWQRRVRRRPYPFLLPERIER
jgi:hypothetical protein